MGELLIRVLQKRIFLCIVLITCAAHCQFYHGIDVGLNMNNAEFASGSSDDPSQKIGLSLGYVAERELNDKLFVRIGFNYNRRSIKTINRNGNYTTNEVWSTDVIELPINLGYYLNFNRRNFQFFVDAGVNAGYINRAINKTETETIYLDIGSDAEVTRLTFGTNLGAGLLIKKRVKFRLNYYYGLSNIVNTDGDTWKNRTIGISVNYFLREKIVY